MTAWFDETLHADLRQRLKIERILYDSETEHQRIVLFENALLGRVLTLDGVVQTTEGDEFVYHEMLTHLPILAHGKVRRVLIVGGGDGGMLEEALKHEDIEQITLVEIDPQVIEFSRRYLGNICGVAFDDPRTRVVIADGVDYVAQCQERYDLIITDSTDPIGPGEVLFTERYYAACKRSLTPGGVLVTQNGVPFLQAEELRDTARILATLFADVSCYLATVPTYSGGPMAFGWASDDPALRKTPAETLERRFADANIATRYYNSAVHAGAFGLPGYVADLLARPA